MRSLAVSMTRTSGKNSCHNLSKLFFSFFEMQNVLVIDDDVDIANLFGMVLGLVGYEFEIANSARDALSRLATSTPDLILLDMALDTELGGQDILYQVRANPRLKNTQVIVITGHPSMLEPVTNLADLTMLKPIDVEQLKAIAIRLKADAQPVKHEYFRDPVTGMYNQDFFFSRLGLAIERAKRRSDFIFAVTVFTISLNLPANLPFDPALFDRILREAASGLLQNLRPTDTIARLSYYKFASLHEELREPDDVKIICNRIRTILTPPFRINDRKISLLFHIGQATSKNNYQTAEDLLIMAEEDMEGTLK
jgi:diguanylate cyclase (GGDEF)-like protein